MTRTLRAIDQWSIRDHIENTKREYPKCYNLSQLSFMEGHAPKWIKARPDKYFQVRVDDSTRLFRFNNGRAKVPYSIRWLRVDEIAKILSRKTGKRCKIIFEED